MFCQKCGAQLTDGASFCTNCGAATSTQTTSAPVKQAQPNPMISKFVSVITSFWKSPTTSVASAAKSNTHEWSLLASISVVIYALAGAVVGLEMFSQVFSSLIGGLSSYVPVGDMYPFFAMFGIGLLVGAGAYGLTSLGVWVVTAQIFKKKVTFIQALNMVAVASLPLIVMHVLNMLLGLIYAPLTLAFLVIGVVMTTVLLYIGIQKFEKLDKSPYYAFSILMASVVVAVFLLSLLYISVITSGITGFANSMMGGMF